MRDSDTGVDEAIVLVKALPPAGEGVGNAMSIAALDLYGNWLCLSPVSFRRVDDAQRFSRWDRLRFRWRQVKGVADPRVEVRRVDQRSIEIIGAVPPVEQAALLDRVVVDSLGAQAALGRSFALLKAEVLGFTFERVSAGELVRRGAKLAQLREQFELFGTAHVLPPEPCPYDFAYQLRDADGAHSFICQDWEMDAAFLKWRKQLGEAQALEAMVHRYGQELPLQGAGFTVSSQPLGSFDWKVHGVIPVTPVAQPTLF